MAMSGSFVPFIPAGRVSPRIFLPAGCARHHWHPRSFPAKLRTQRKIGAALVDLQILHVDTNLSQIPFAAQNSLWEMLSLCFSQLKLSALLGFEGFFLHFFHLFLADVAVNQSGVGPIRHLIFLNNLLSAV